MNIIKAKTDDRKILFVSAPEITSGDRYLDTLAILPDESWSFAGAEYFVSFFKDDPGQGVIVKCTAADPFYVCAVPNEMLVRAGVIHFGFFAQAEDGVVKTSEIASYRIGQGAATQSGAQSSGNDAASAKAQLIELINVNTRPGLLDDSMDYDALTLAFSTYMDQIQVQLSCYQTFCDDIYNLIRENVNPDVEQEDDLPTASLVYLMELILYFRTAGTSSMELERLTQALNLANAENQALNEDIAVVLQSLQSLYIGGTA